MSRKLFSGSYKIVSLTDGNPPVGIDFTLPTVQPVRIDGPSNRWTLKKVGDSAILLGVGGYPFTRGTRDNRVIASISSEDSQQWRVTYAELQGAFTIALAKDRSLGWTVVDDSTEIEIAPIIETRSNPPRYLPKQLFRFEPLDEEV